MHKWQIVSVVSLSLIGLCGPVLASDANAIAPTNDTMGCAGLIQQGDVDPPVPTSDLHSVQVCISHCDSLYRGLGDQGRFIEMVVGANYCRKSLNNLYYASVAQTITEQLNQQTELQQAAAQQSTYEKMSQFIKQHQQSQQAATNPPEDQTTNTNTTTSSPPPAQPPVNLDNVNW